MHPPNTLSPPPIHSLPPEILHIIFALVCTSGIDGCCDISDLSSCASPALSISHVCRHWRSVAISCEDLWSHFYLAIDEESNDLDLEPWVHLHLRRSGTRGLNFGLSYWSRQVVRYPALEALLAQSHRWVDITLVVDTRLYFLEHIPVGSFPKITSLHVYYYEDTGNDGYDLAYSGPVIPWSQLVFLEICNPPMIHHLEIIKLCAGLQQLVLRIDGEQFNIGIWGDSDDDELGPYWWERRDYTYRILKGDEMVEQEMVWMYDSDLEDRKANSEEPEKPVTLAINSLNVRYAGLAASALFEMFTMPSLTQLDMELCRSQYMKDKWRAEDISCFYFPVFRSFITRSKLGHTLTTFCIRELVVSGYDLVAVLHLLPAIQHLTLLSLSFSADNTSELVTEELIKEMRRSVGDGQLVLLPNLATLELRTEQVLKAGAKDESFVKMISKRRDSLRSVFYEKAYAPFERSLVPLLKALRAGGMTIILDDEDGRVVF